MTALDVLELKRKWCCLGLLNCPIPLMSHFVGVTPPVVSCCVSHLWLGIIVLGYLSYGAAFFFSFQNHCNATIFMHTPCAPVCYYFRRYSRSGPRHEHKNIELVALVVVELWKLMGRYSTFKPWRRGQFVLLEAGDQVV